jgi:hypothetical protein
MTGNHPLEIDRRRTSQNVLGDGQAWMSQLQWNRGLPLLHFHARSAMGFFHQLSEKFNVNSAVQTFVQTMPQPARSGKRNAFLVHRVQKFSLQESMIVQPNYAVVDAKHNSPLRRKSSGLKFNALLVSEVFE